MQGKGNFYFRSEKLGKLSLTEGKFYFLGVQGEEELEPVPSEDLCRPYIEKALKDLGTGNFLEALREYLNGAQRSLECFI